MSLLNRTNNVGTSLHTAGKVIKVAGLTSAILILSAVAAKAKCELTGWKSGTQVGYFSRTITKAEAGGTPKGARRICEKFGKARIGALARKGANRIRLEMVCHGSWAGHKYCGEIFKKAVGGKKRKTAPAVRRHKKSSAVRRYKTAPTARRYKKAPAVRRRQQGIPSGWIMRPCKC